MDFTMDVNLHLKERLIFLIFLDYKFKKKNFLNFKLKLINNFLMKKEAKK